MDQTEMDLYRLFQFYEVSSYITKMHTLDDSNVLYNFEVEFKYNNLDLRNIINNKPILKEGYYSCSYLLYDETNKNIQLTYPIKSKNDKGYPLKKPENKNYSNILIHHKILGNIKNNELNEKSIIGVIYYFTPSFKENEDKFYYLIDIIFYNNIVNNTNNYKLNYIFYNKNNYLKISNDDVVDNSNLINYLQNGKNNFLNMKYINENKMDLLYNSFKSLGNNKLLTKKCLDLSIEKIGIFESLKINTISDIIKYTISLIYDNKKIEFDNDKNINLNFCNIQTNINSKFYSYLEDIKKIIDFTNKIHKNLEIIVYNINKVKSIYLKFISEIHKISTEDYISIIINKTDFLKLSSTLKSMIEMRGFKNDSRKKNTFYGIKNNIIELNEEINIFILNINEIVLRLKDTMDVNLKDIKDQINIIFENIEKYNDLYEHNRRIININTCSSEILKRINIEEENNILENIFYLINTEYEINNSIIEKLNKEGFINELELEKLHKANEKNLKDIDKHKNKIDHKHKYYFINNKNIGNTNDYQIIENINSIKYSELPLLNLDMSKVNHIFNEIEMFYEYLNFNSESNRELKTLCDIFFFKNKTNTSSEDYIMFNLEKDNIKTYDILEKKYKNIDKETGIPSIKNEDEYKKILPQLPKDNNIFMSLYNKLLEPTTKTFKPINNILFNVDILINYKNKINNYELMKDDLIKISDNIRKLCISYNSMILNNNKKESIIKNIKNIKEGLEEDYLNYDLNSKSIKTKENVVNLKNISLYLKNIMNTRNIFRFSDNNLFKLPEIKNNQYNLSISIIKKFIDKILIDEEKNENYDINNVLDLLSNINRLFDDNIDNIKINLKDISKEELNDYIIIFYSFIISCLAVEPNIYFNILLNISKNNSLSYLFKNTLLNNKIYISNLYNFELEETYIELISRLGNIKMNKTLIDLNEKSFKDELLKIQKEIVEVFKNKDSIKNKISLIYKFIKNDTKDFENLKIFTEIINTKLIDNSELKNKQLELCKNYFQKNNHYNLHLSNNIQKIFDKENYYSYKTFNNNNNLHCIYKNNNNFDCRNCNDDDKSNLKITGLNKCPINLPSNIDDYTQDKINNSLSDDYLYYILSNDDSLSDKMLIFKDNLVNNKIVLGKIEEDYKLVQLNNWRCILNYNDDTVYKSINDKLAIIKLYSTLESENISFYLNNFYINNKISKTNEDNILYKYPNSHQLFVKNISDNLYNIYFIDNSEKYYLYLNKKREQDNKKNNIDVVFRKKPKLNEQLSEKFIDDNIIWKFIKKADYVEDIFDKTKKLFNIRCLNDMKKTDDNSNYKYNEIEKILHISNNMFSYNDILKNLFSNKNKNNESILSEYSYEFIGNNNKYNIKSLVNNDTSIFNSNNPMILIDYIDYNVKNNIKHNKLCSLSTAKESEKLLCKKYEENLLLEKKKLGLNDNGKQNTYYLIKKYKENKYLYLDIDNKIIFIELFNKIKKK